MKKKNCTELIEVDFPPRESRDSYNSRAKLLHDYLYKLPSAQFPTVPKMDFNKVLNSRLGLVGRQTKQSFKERLAKRCQHLI